MKELYKPFISKSKNKKYSVYVVKNGKTKLINFGQLPYQHYKDKLKKYSHLNHNDKNRLKRYYQRFKKTKDKNSALYWSNKILW